MEAFIPGRKLPKSGKLTYANKNEIRVDLGRGAHARNSIVLMFTNAESAMLADTFAAKPARHEGWTNYPTWVVQLWIDNSEPHYIERRDMAKRAARETGSHDGAVTLLAERLETWVTGMVPDMGGTMFGDLITSALSDVNWREIADAWITEGNDA